MTRLKLDFSLESAQDRLEFTQNYMRELPFDPNQGELEQLADYLLWGKDVSGEPLGKGTGLKTRWAKPDENFESLEALSESPAFSDLTFKPLSEAAPTKRPRANFSRSETRKNAPPHILKAFEALWAQIDREELLTNFYEIQCGKRADPPRDELLARFTEEERANLEAKAAGLTQFAYLKLRHDLIELRKEQFVYQDLYKATIKGEKTPELPRLGAEVVYDYDVEVLPLGLVDNPCAPLIYGAAAVTFNFEPRTYSEPELRKVSDLVWRKRGFISGTRPSLDFRRVEDVYTLEFCKRDLEEEVERHHALHRIEENLDALLATLEFYERAADLTPIQREILEMKVDHKRNQDISEYINGKYKKSYTANYISTIFKQKIVAKICEAAQLHQDSVENLFFEENFKKCTCCGRSLLLDERNWVRKARSKDGFQSKCKRCEREQRKAKGGLTK